MLVTFASLERIAPVGLLQFHWMNRRLTEVQLPSERVLVLVVRQHLHHYQGQRFALPWQTTEDAVFVSPSKDAPLLRSQASLDRSGV